MASTEARKGGIVIRNIRLFGVVATVGSIALSGSGCTALGYGIGAAVDAGNTRSYQPVSAQAWTVQPGKKGDLYLRDGTRLRVTYRGVAPLPPTEYAAYYERRRVDLEATQALPALGDTMTLILTNGDYLEAPCLGFDYSVPSGDAERPAINIGYGGLVVTRKSTWNVIPFAAVREVLEVDGSTIAGARLDSLAAKGAIPMRTGLAFEGPSGRQWTQPIGDILALEVKSHAGRTTGLVVGGIIDATLIVGAIAVANSDWGTIDFEGQLHRR